MSLFEQTIQRKNSSRPPVWFMRQAGRYHHHYQNLRKQYSFMELCKIPEVACEVTMGPIREFDFDAAILFSDLLFPLEEMGMGLRYEEGPKLDWHLREINDLKKLKGGGHLVQGLEYQAQALKLIRKELPSNKGLLGFVGGPLTLYCYAVEGSHKGSLDSALKGIEDGRWEGFFQLLKDLLIENILMQAQAGADVVMIIDTCAGEFEPKVYREKIVPALKQVMEEVKLKNPHIPLAYYSKKTGPQHWESLIGLPISCLGIDWNHDLSEVLTQWHSHWAIQGNIDPHWLFLDSEELEKKLRSVFQKVKNLPEEYRKGWICGLGHGILPKTPESNVHLFLKLQKEYFSKS